MDKQLVETTVEWKVDLSVVKRVGYLGESVEMWVDPSVVLLISTSDDRLVSQLVEMSAVLMVEMLVNVLVE